MKTNAAIFAGGLMLALGACSGGNDVSTGSADADGDGTVSVAEAEGAMSASGFEPEPGLYRSTSDFAGMEDSVEYCITPEMAEQGVEAMMREGQTGECSYEEFNLSGAGELDAVMVCALEEGSMRMEMEGTLTPTSSDMVMTMSGDVGGQSMTMTANSKSERIGDC